MLLCVSILIFSQYKTASLGLPDKCTLQQCKCRQCKLTFIKKLKQNKNNTWSEEYWQWMKSIHSHTLKIVLNRINLCSKCEGQTKSYWKVTCNSDIHTYIHKTQLSHIHPIQYIVLVGGDNGTFSFAEFQAGGGRREHCVFIRSEESLKVLINISTTKLLLGCLSI